MTGASDTKPIWPDRMPNVNVNAKIIDHPGGEEEEEVQKKSLTFSTINSDFSA